MLPSSALDDSYLQEMHNSIFKSCLNFEVKVMEHNAKSDTFFDSDGKEVQLDTCSLCVGVLHQAHRLESEGDSSFHAENVTTSRESLDDVNLSALHPKDLTSGLYEVLLYTFYNPEVDIDVTLVGKAIVRVHISEYKLPTLSEVAASQGTHNVSKSVNSQKAFDLALFASLDDDCQAFTYWLHCFCRNGLKLTEVTEQQQAAAQSLFSLDDTSPKDMKQFKRMRAKVMDELTALLGVLGAPLYAEKHVHDKIADLLRQSDPSNFRYNILPALHTYFQVKRIIC